MDHVVYDNFAVVFVCDGMTVMETIASDKIQIFTTLKDLLLCICNLKASFFKFSAFHNMKKKLGEKSSRTNKFPKKETNQISWNSW